MRLHTHDNSPWPPPDLTEEILGRHLDRDFRVFPMSDNNALADTLATLGNRFGVAFPTEFCGHVCGRFPGIFIEVKEEAWPRPNLYDVGPFWSFLYGLHTFTPCSDGEDWMRLDAVTYNFQEATGHIAAPILKIIGDADVYCVTNEGGIARYNHETNELDPETVGFWALFEREVKELKERKVSKALGT
jgi:hypothetical protein